jgi:hypothetical protein
MTILILGFGLNLNATENANHPVKKSKTKNSINKTIKYKKSPTKKIEKTVKTIKKVTEKTSKNVVLPKDLSISEMPWTKSSQNVIKNAPCKELKILTIEKMQEIIDSKKNRDSHHLLSTNIFGVEITDESPILIKAFKELTTSLDNFGSYPVLKNQIDFQRTFKIGPHCDKVECAVKKIWGNEMGVKILYINLVYNFTASEYAFSSSDRFTASELNDVLISLADFPTHLFALTPPNQRLTHFDRNRPYPLDPGAYANAYGMIFDNWSKEGSIVRQYTLYHELSHEVSYWLKHLDEDPRWLDISGWIKKGDDVSHRQNGCFPTVYSKTSPAEDFAESLTAYRYNARSFKARCPLKYNFIKEEVYNNIEYLSAESCSDSKTTPVNDIVNEEKAPFEEKTSVNVPIKAEESIIPSEEKNDYPTEQEKLLEIN